MLTEEIYAELLDIASYFVWNRESAEDITQEAALSLFRWPPKEKIDNMRNFLVRVIKNIIALKYRTSEEDSKINFDSTESLKYMPGGENPESNLSFKDTMEYIFNNLMGWEWAILYFGPSSCGYTKRSGQVRQTTARQHLNKLLFGGINEI